MVTFDDVWANIRSHAGEEFRTVTGLPFTYSVDREAVLPSRTSYRLGRRNFETAFGLMPLGGPGQISRMVRGPAYVFAILSDPRVCG